MIDKQLHISQVQLAIGFNVVPAPSALAILGMGGMGGMVATRRRRRREDATRITLFGWCSF